MSLEKIDFELILCFKRHHDDVKVFAALIKAISDYANIGVEYITMHDVAHMLNRTVARIGLLSTEEKIRKWYDSIRTSCLHIEDSSNRILNDFVLVDRRQLSAIRHILGFSNIIRWSNLHDIPGLEEYLGVREKE